LTIDSNNNPLTEFLVHQSDNEFAAIIAYSLAQIDVYHSIALSFQIAIYQNEPHTVEQLIHSLISSSALISNQFPPAPISIVRAQSACGSFNQLKFILPLANSAVAGSSVAAKLTYKANLLDGIVTYHLNQHDYTTEQVAELLAPKGAPVYLYQSFVSQLIGACLNTSDVAKYEDILSECIAWANFDIQSLVEKLKLILDCIKKVACRVALILHKEMSTLSGPVSMLHPGAGQIIGTIGNIAGRINRY
ncbi:MAG: hypothetical protein EZS28_048781, partial [Streblomastix strix]